MWQGYGLPELVDLVPLLTMTEAFGSVNGPWRIRIACASANGGPGDCVEGATLIPIVVSMPGLDHSEEMQYAEHDAP